MTLTAKMKQVLWRYAEANNLDWLGCMENDDEMVFAPRGEKATIDNMTFMWWIESKEELGTFEEYCEENRTRQ